MKYSGYPAELELLLQIEGPEVVARWGDLEQSPFVDPMTQEYNYLLRRA